MTKTELKKQTTKRVLNLLIEEFNAYNINREAQYFEFWTDYKSHRFQLQMDTRGYDISSWDSVKLSGDGWSQEDIDKQKFAVELEDLMEKKVRELVAS
jgi:hypothetical protein